MDVDAILAPDAGPALGRSRAKVLDLLRNAHSPLSVQDIADSTGLHPNTARFHLDALADAGLATREPEPRRAPGRPSIVYRSSGEGGPSGSRHYRLLAEMLTSLIAGTMPDPASTATEAGLMWGRYLTEQPLPYQHVDPDEAVAGLTAMLEQMGFSPEAVTEDGQTLLHLRACPFLEVAESHREVVCSLHLGLMQGVLAKMRAPLTADRLEPFAQPGRCVAHLTTRERSADAG